MTDVFSPAKRSAIMASIKGRGTKTTELALRLLLRQTGIKGWRFHLHGIQGNPDFAFLSRKLAVFVDGCFWHGCRKCPRGKLPLTNRSFWQEKIEKNRRRDIKVNALLRRSGWRTIRILEHDLRRNPAAIVSRIVKGLDDRRSQPGG